MDPTLLIMWLGFILAGYAVVGNDSIQTLGTFLSSNEEKPWYVLWAFAGSILAATLLYGWYAYGGDVSYGRLEKYAFVENMRWPYLLPPLVLMLLTRTGIPVSTSFLVLTFFKPKGLWDMTEKSILGYALAFCVAIMVWQLVTKVLDKRFIDSKITPSQRRNWTVLQWASTGFLWGQWLIQDFANIYVYLPRTLTGFEIGLSLVILLIMLAIIFYSKGGNIQKIVKAKTNTTDIRSATIVDFIYGLLLLFFKEFSNVPMSTTWVFLGLLAGREIAIRYTIELIQEPSDLVKARRWRYLGMALNVLILALIGYVVYLRNAATEVTWLIPTMAGAMITRAFVAYQETIPGQLNLKVAYKDILSDLTKVTFGLLVSVALVYLMRYLLTGSLSDPI
jgi:zinc transporter ZupT